jgi:hypothetical protein
VKWGSVVAEQGPDVRTGRIEPDGRFAVEGLGPGQWHLHAGYSFAHAPRSGEPPAEGIDVDVSDADVTGVHLPAPRR